MKLQLIIPMSGIGKRFLDVGYKVPKFLIEVEGKSVIEHVVECIQELSHQYLFVIRIT